MLSKKEMNEFFERLKNDDRFMELFNEFTNEFKVKFVIHDEPDKDLKNILKKCPDDLLNMIWKETMPEAAAIEGGREYREKTLLEAYKLEPNNPSVLRGLGCIEQFQTFYRG